MADFEAELARLCSREMIAARRDPERLGAMVEHLSHSLSFTIAIGAGGDPQVAQKLMTGVESYLYDSVTGMAPSGRAVGTGEPS